MRRAAITGITAAAVAVTVGAVFVAVAALSPRNTDIGTSPLATPAPTAPAAEAGAETEPTAQAEAFLAEWVEDGRVIRRDQGGDTVSEGQAYGLLAAVVVGDEDAFDEIWAWTDRELVRPDGLLAWQWEDGAVVDDEPASDADLDAARALVLAGAAFDRADLSEAGSQLGEAILDDLTVETDQGRVLLPGLWAAERDPLPYNPSYASPAAYAVLAQATGDPRWDELAEGSRAVTAEILQSTALPPDWAQIREDGSIEPMPGPFGTGDPVQYGFDAPRLVLRYAESCHPADVELAASALAALSYQPEPAARLDLGGGALTDDRSPLGIAARGAAAVASGDDASARTDLESAAALAEAYPTYYGAAWTALASAMLTDSQLGGCPPLEEES